MVENVKICLEQYLKNEYLLRNQQKYWCLCRALGEHFCYFNQLCDVFGNFLIACNSQVVIYFLSL